MQRIDTAPAPKSGIKKALHKTKKAPQNPPHRIQYCPLTLRRQRFFNPGLVQNPMQINKIRDKDMQKRAVRISEFNLTLKTALIADCRVISAPENNPKG